MCLILEMHGAFFSPATPVYNVFPFYHVPGRKTCTIWYIFLRTGREEKEMMQKWRGCGMIAPKQRRERKASGPDYAKYG